MTSRTIMLLSFLGLCLGACSVSPVPEPPDPQTDPPVLPGPIEWAGCPVCNGAGIHGDAGAAGDATTIWAVNLDRTEPPISALVNDDGSFDLFIVAIGGEEIRVEAQDGSLHSAPLDLLLLDDESGLVPASRPFAECFEVEPELGFEGVTSGESSQATIALRHDCDGPLVIESIATLTDATSFTIAGPSTPLSLEPGFNGTINVTFTAPDGFGTADFLVEEAVLVIEIGGPERDRRSIHLHGDAEP